MRIIVNRYGLVVLLILGSKLSACAQTFDFGIESGVGLSQIDGDNLVGFNKVSFDANIFTSVRFWENSNWKSSIGFGTLGSRRFDERSDIGIKKIVLRRITISNALLFGIDDSWDGQSQHKIGFGVTYSRMISEKVTLINATVLTDENSNIFGHNAFSGRLIYSYSVSPNIHIGLEGEYFFTNILTGRIDNVRIIKPYQLQTIIGYQF